LPILHLLSKFQNAITPQLKIVITHFSTHFIALYFHNERAEQLWSLCACDKKCTVLVSECTKNRLINLYFCWPGEAYSIPQRPVAGFRGGKKERSRNERMGKGQEWGKTGKEGRVRRNGRPHSGF